MRAAAVLLLSLFLFDACSFVRAAPEKRNSDDDVVGCTYANGIVDALWGGAAAVAGTVSATTDAEAEAAVAFGFALTGFVSSVYGFWDAARCNCEYERERALAARKPPPRRRVEQRPPPPVEQPPVEQPVEKPADPAAPPTLTPEEIDAIRKVP